MEAFDQIILGENVHFCKFCHKSETHLKHKHKYLQFTCTCMTGFHTAGHQKQLTIFWESIPPDPPISCMKPCMIANLQIQIYTHVQFNYN